MKQRVGCGPKMSRSPPRKLRSLLHTYALVDQLTGHLVGSIVSVSMKRQMGGRKKSRSATGKKRPGGRRVIAASEFKAHCLRVLEDVASGQEVVVTKRGKEMALVQPVRPRRSGSSRGRWKGMVTVNGDIVHTDWSSEFDASQ